jgi:hypothetical protein
VVQRHGGIFTVHSQLGEGTRMKATLRLDQEEPTPTTGPDQFYTSAGPLPTG